MENSVTWHPAPTDLAGMRMMRWKRPESKVAALINAGSERGRLDLRRHRIGQSGDQGAARFYSKRGKHIVTCKTEHKAVLDTCRQLAGRFEVTYLDPKPDGLIDLAKLRRRLEMTPPGFHHACQQ